MEDKSTPTQRFSYSIAASLFGAFLGIRLLSYFIYLSSAASSVFAIGLLGLIAFISYRAPRAGLILLSIELLIGGTGTLVECAGISLRTLLLPTYLLIFAYHYKTHLRNWLKNLPTYIHILAWLPPALATISGAIGIMHGFPIKSVIQDMIPFSYTLLVYPLSMYRSWIMAHRTTLASYGATIMFGWVLWALIQFGLFSTQAVVLHGSWYNFLRDAMAAKITHLGFDAWRVVFPEYLLLPASMLIALLNPTWITQRSKAIYLVSSAVILALSLSRTHLIGLVVLAGVLVLFHHARITVLARFVLLTIIMLCSLSALHLTASNGVSHGLQHLGLRIAAVVDPTAETSTHSRMLLLGSIKQTMQAHPMTGTGLGSSLSFLPPGTHVREQTRHYDWGWFEWMTEFGLILFTLLEIALIALAVHLLKVRSYASLALFGALCAMMLIMPVFSHVFGIVLVTFVVSLQPTQA